MDIKTEMKEIIKELEEKMADVRLELDHYKAELKALKQ